MLCLRLRVGQSILMSLLLDLYLVGKDRVVFAGVSRWRKWLGLWSDGSVVATQW